MAQVYPPFSRLLKCDAVHLFKDFIRLELHCNGALEASLGNSYSTVTHRAEMGKKVGGSQ